MPQSIELTEHPHSAAFFEDALSLLLEREAENTLIFGKFWHSRSAQPQGGNGFFTVNQNGRVVAAAVIPAPWPMVIARAEDDAIEVIVRHLVQGGINVTGVNAPAETARAFVAAYAPAAGVEARLHLPLSTFQISRVIPPRRVSGALCPASDGDLDLLADWCVEYSREVEGSPIDARAHASQLIADGRVFLWKDPGVVSMAAWAGPTPNGIRVNHVYTPPVLRGRGYASATVAALTQQLLDGGRKFVFLHTDQRNPTSNSIYRKLGYQHVGDALAFEFVKSENVKT